MGNQVSSPGPAAAAPSGDSIGAAAKKLSDASYPFLKSVDWTSDIYLKPLPGVSAKDALKAIDKPTSKVMDVYNAFAKIVPGTVPNKLFSTVDPLAANAAAKAFYEFKDVVKAAR